MDLNFDVLVLGGTMEGCAAAAVAADRGLRVAVVENSGSLGGLSTNGLYSYFPAVPEGKTIVDEADAIRLELARALGMDTDTPALYREQMMKIALAEMLRRRGVAVFTHMFMSSPLIEDGELRGFKIGGKTGDKTFRVSWIVDATDGLETAGYLGYDFAPTGKPARLGVKMNGIALTALAKSAENLKKDDPSQAIGSLSFPFRWECHGVTVSCEELTFLADKRCGEVIVHGLTAPASSLDPLALSALQMALRRGAYRLLEELRVRGPGFDKARIIHVAPRMDLYGVRVQRGPTPYGNLSLCHGIEPGNYDSVAAIARGSAVTAFFPKLTG